MITPLVKLTVNFIKERDKVVAYAPALDISTVGDTEAHAKTRFEELLKVFMDDIVEQNVADQVLTELGWTKVNARIQGRSQWVPPVVTSINLPVRIAA